MSEFRSWRFWAVLLPLLAGAVSVVIAVPSLLAESVDRFCLGFGLGYLARRVADWAASAAWAVREAAADERVLEMLGRYPDLNAGPLARLCRLGDARVFAVLWRLERDGRVTSAWEDGPYPRRRLYRVAAGSEVGGRG